MGVGVWVCGGHTIMSMLVVNSLRHGVSGVKYVIIGIRINHLLSRTYTMQIWRCCRTIRYLKSQLGHQITNTIHVL